MAGPGILPERYQGPELVARGGMGEVYRAEDSTLGRIVAVKLLSNRYADDEGIRRRFTHEALAAARLSNVPSAVTIFDVGEHEGRPFIVMEYLPGGSLAERVAAQGAQPPGRVLEWLGHAAEALDAAHERGIVHRDVKPGNLLLDDDGDVRVADFGVASAAGLDSFTATGTILGTAGYLAPEQARGETTGPPSDRYALGVVAFELLTGSRPFERESVTAEAAAHVNAPVPAVSAANPELPPELDAVIERALAKDPGERFESCADFVAALRNAFDAAAGHTAVVGAAPRRTAVAGAPLGRTPPQRRHRARNPLPYVLLVLGALLLAGVALALALGDEDGGRTAETTRPQTPPQTQQTTATTATTAEQTTQEQTTQEQTTEAQTTEPESGDAAALNDQGFRLMQAGDYDAALPLLEQAVDVAEGTGTLTEAYASYNLAFTRKRLGDCSGVLELLDRSEQVQGQRTEIDQLRAEAQRDCSGDGDGDD